MHMAAVTKYSTTHSSPPHFMEVSGQLHLPATLHMGKQSRAGLDVLENSDFNKQTFHCQQMSSYIRR